MWNVSKVVKGIRMSKIDLSLPSKFMDACVAKEIVKALRLSGCNASILSSEYRLPIATMIKELRKYEA